jgi:hypothetical protein
MGGTWTWATVVYTCCLVGTLRGLANSLVFCRKFPKKIEDLSISRSLVRHNSRAQENSSEESDMAARQTTFRSFKSIAGAALLGLGMFVLYENMTVAAARLSHVLGANGSKVLGILPAVVLAVSQTVQAYALDHQRFLHSLIQQMFVSSWPLLLVIFGTVLSRDTFSDKSRHVKENKAELLNFPPPCPTYRFTRSRPATSPGPKT